MLKIRYSAPLALELSGSVRDLALVSEEVQALLKEPLRQEITFEAETLYDPLPYSEILSELIIRKSLEPASVRLSDSSLLVSGPNEALDAFATFLDFEPDSAPGLHSHYEYYPEHPFLDPHSLPLVITVV